MTIDELQEEFVANKDFSAIIIGSKASGSGTSKDGQNKSTRNGATEDGKPVPLSGLSPKELAEHVKSSKNQE